jgi:hypothetical protein
VVTSRRFAPARAEALAARLELEPSPCVCTACLVIVSIALDRGDEREIARELRRITLDLWCEGLAPLAADAVERACERGVPNALAGLADLEEKGPRSPVARAIVRRLARELSRQVRLELRLQTRARERLSLAPPELN